MEKRRNNTAKAEARERVLVAIPLLKVLTTDNRGTREGDKEKRKRRREKRGEKKEGRKKERKEEEACGFREGRSGKTGRRGGEARVVTRPRGREDGNKNKAAWRGVARRGASGTARSRGAEEQPRNLSCVASALGSRRRRSRAMKEEGAAAEGGQENKRNNERSK